MIICDGIETGVEYYWDKTDSWTWIDGSTRWWQIFVVFSGINGGGGANVKKLWRWNGSPHTIRNDYANLTFEETDAMIEKIKANFLESVSS